LGARFVLVPNHLEVDLRLPRYTPVYGNDLVRVYRNEDALPRMRLVAAARHVTAEEARQALASGTIAGAPVDGRRVALVEVPTDLDRAAPPAAAESRLRTLSSEGGIVEVASDSATAGLLVHGTNFAPGWEVSLDGSPRPLLRVDGLVQGVVVPAGAHVVRFRYRPASFAVGAALSLTGLALALLVAGGFPGRMFPGALWPQRMR
ncbi:MAG TPA: hypothetical protein VFK70_05010, partial [Vicinamibacteria bacterium]|nr:hypothetical protein [Vicinamibacteria bacterium]